MGGRIKLEATKLSFLRALRLATFRFQVLVARGETATRLYIEFVSRFSRLVPSQRIRAMANWAVTGQCVPWKPLKFGARTVTVGDMTQIMLHPHLGEFDQAALFTKQLDYEKPVFVWLERHACERYDAIIEVGANVGVYTVFFDALSRRPTGRLKTIYAFEPSPKAFGRLLTNLAANEARSVVPFPVAVAEETGFLQFYEPEGHLTNGSLVRGFAENFTKNVRQNTIVALAGATLEPMFARHQRVLLKIDAEGFEPKILVAMEPLLERYRPDLLIEVLDGTDAELRAFDSVKAYDCYLLTPDGPSQRAVLSADPSSRDWLLTMSPL